MSSMFETVGLYSIVLLLYYVLMYVFRLLYTARIAKVLGHTLDLKTLGSWAVVTGSTDGIGKAYAEELASRGFNVVLISRSIQKLQDVASELSERYAVKTKVVQADFTEATELYQRIAETLEPLDIGVLINNVGMSYEYPEYFTLVPNVQKLSMELINCNIHSVVKMSLIVLPKMIKKRKGFILNISSIAAILPSPLYALYSGTKTFVRKFSEDLATECKTQGVTIECVVPGVIKTKMSRIKGNSITCPVPAMFVKEHLNSVGLQTVYSGYWVHAIQIPWYLIPRFKVVFAVIVVSGQWYQIFRYYGPTELNQKIDSLTRTLAKKGRNIADEES